MKKVTQLFKTVVVCISVLAIPLSYAASASSIPDLSPEELMAAHLKSLGDPTLLSSVQTRAFVGSTDVEFIQGMTGKIQGGTSTMVADGDKMSLILKYNSVDYPQEYFTYNGENVDVGYIAPGQRSPLADFIFRFNGIMKKGFLGGTLSLGWPLLDYEHIKAKLKCKTKTIDGKELYELEWPINILGNIKIRMYFDPETYNHVRTEYDVHIQEDVSIQSPGSYLGEMGSDTEDSSGYSSMMGPNLIPDSWYKLIERFDDFQKVSGMNLPHKYTLEYELQGQGHSFLANWTINAKNFIFNRKFDPELFEPHK
ncbi:MAG: hypothetical protein P8Z37_04500 [Acidobacteriota bacterium]